MTEGVIWKQVLLFAVPILLSNLLQQLYYTMGSIIVGQFVGKVALAAVGNSGMITNLFIGFFVGLSTGEGVIISRYYGAGDIKTLHDAVHTSVALAIVSGVAIGAVGFIFTPTILRLIDTPQDVFEQSVGYLRIVFAGTVFTTIYNIGGGIMRAIGDSKRPLYYLAVCSVINIALSILFVKAFDMGINGVAYATVIAQAISAALVMISLIRTTLPVRVIIKHIRINVKRLAEIVKIGIPAGLQSVVINLSNIIIQSFINGFGSTAMAGFTAASRIDSFVFMVLNALALTVTTFVGQNVGAGQLERAKRGSRVCILLSAGLTLATGLFLASFSRFFISLLNGEPDVVEYGSQIVRIFGTCYILHAIPEAMSGSMRGAGSSFIPMLISLLTLCVFRVAYLYVLVPIFDNIHVITWCYPVSWVLNTIVFSIVYFKGDWLRRHEKAEAV